VAVAARLQAVPFQNKSNSFTRKTKLVAFLKGVKTPTIDFLCELGVLCG
jgi:hypothetical protein